MSDIIDQDELMDKFGAKRQGDLLRILKENRIPFFLGIRGRIVTTNEAINQRLNGTVVNGEPGGVTFT